MFAQALKAFINLDYLYFDFHSGLYLRNIHYKWTKNPIKSKKNVPGLAQNCLPSEWLHFWTPPLPVVKQKNTGLQIKVWDVEQKKV